VGSAVAGTTVWLYALPISLLYAVAVLSLVKVGLYTPGRAGATLGAYAPHGSVTLDRAALPDRAYVAVGSGPALPAHGVYHRVAMRIGWDAHCKTEATCVAAAPDARGKAPTDVSNPEDALYHALRAEIHATAAPGGEQGKDVK
jgi:hypothetical protein